MIATDPIGGPGKGLFQFLKHAPCDVFDYVLCNFDVKNRPFGQFIQEARRRELNLILLKQRTTLDPSLVLQARRVVLEHDINLIQTHGYKSNVIGFFLRWICRRPWVGFAHGYTDDNLKVRIYNRVERSVLRYANRIVAVSGSMKSLMVTHGVPEDKIRVVYNAVEPSEAVPTSGGEEIKRQLGVSSQQKVVGVIGRLNPEKGQRVFLAAMEQVVRKYRNVKGVIIGDGQDREALERFCDEKELRGHVTFVGYQASIADYYPILDLLVLPSLSEGLPNTVLEAMTFGVPVLATSVGGVPEIIGKDNGILVPPNDPEVLSARIVELLENESLRRSIGSNGKKSLYPRFDPDHRVRQIVNLYDELLSTRTAH